MLFICLLTVMNSLQAQPEYDIYDLESLTYQPLVTAGNNYTVAINTAIQDATANGGGVILFPGNKIVGIDSNIVMENNITFRASHSMTTIKIIDYSSTTSGSQLILMSPYVVAGQTIEPRENVTFENIIFDGDKLVNGIRGNSSTHKNINILNCVFLNTAKNEFGSSIYLENATDINIKNCKFIGGNLGIDFTGRNTSIRIEDNTFDKDLDNSAIRIQGNQAEAAFSNHVWIRGNEIHVGRSTSIINTIVPSSPSAATLERDPDTGAVTGLSSVNNPNSSSVNYNASFNAWIFGTLKGHYAIYIHAQSSADNPTAITYYHENIVIENNIAIGPDYGFFDGGSADLYALKDIVRLKCLNNIARNSGDLGFAIVNCASATVSGNTAGRNNSSGIGIFDTRNSVFTGNIIENNGLRRDYMYNSTPYGGILVVGGSSYNNLIEGNHFFNFAFLDVSLPIELEYTERDNPTDFYGIVIRPTFIDSGSGEEVDYQSSPFLNKIGNNHYAGQLWGPIYNLISSTQIIDDFAAITFPKNRDYPLGTWIRNSNLNNSALGWSVVNRVETQLYADWTVPGAGVSPAPIKILDNDDTNTVQVGDIIGIMLNGGSIHWSLVNAKTQQIGYYNVELAQYPTENVTEAGVTDPTTANSDYNMDRIVILRWLTVTK